MNYYCPDCLNELKVLDEQNFWCETCQSKYHLNTSSDLNIPWELK